MQNFEVAMITRRTFLALSAGAWMPLPLFAVDAPFRLRAEPCEAQILPEGEAMSQMLGFNGRTPGPELRVMQGDLLSFVLENNLSEGTAVHSHGIHLPNEMDGVPGLTQRIVEPGETFTYSYRPPHAGTFWYHSHHRSWEQVARGLYGPLIVTETKPPVVNHDVTVILDDWRIRESGEIVQNFDNMHDFSHAGRLGTFARAISTVQSVRKGDRIRLRMINAATAREFHVQIKGGDGVVVAYDGMPLPVPEPLTDITLAPAQRSDVIIDVSESIEFFLQTRQGPYELGTIVANEINDSPIDSPIQPIEQTQIYMPDMNAPTELTLTINGGAMGTRHGGDGIWALNNHSGMPDEPLLRIKRGHTAVIKIINETAFSHGMHLHGHHFHEISNNKDLGHYRDTTLVQPQDSQTIACVFANPGKWLFHCHTLDHQASGLKTWVEVT